MEWISAAEGDKVKSVINDMVAKIEKLGPLKLPSRFEEWDKEMDEFEKTVNQNGKNKKETVKHG